MYAVCLCDKESKRRSWHFLVIFWKFCKDGIQGPGEMAQSVRSLPCKHETWVQSSNPMWKPSPASHSYNPSTRETDRRLPITRYPASLAKSANSRLSERPCLTEHSKKQLWKPQCWSPIFIHMHACRKWTYGGMGAECDLSANNLTITNKREGHRERQTDRSIEMWFCKRAWVGTRQPHGGPKQVIGCQHACRTTAVSEGRKAVAG